MRTHDDEGENPSYEVESRKIITETVVQGSLTFSSKRVHDDISSSTRTTMEAIDFFMADALLRDSEVRSD
jgi:hypothetical protein